MSDNTKTPYVPESYTSLSGHVGVQQKLYTRAEVDAMIAAAYEAIAQEISSWTATRNGVSVEPSRREIANHIVSELTPASARAALNEAIAQARLEEANWWHEQLDNVDYDRTAPRIKKLVDEARKGER